MRIEDFEQKWSSIPIEEKPCQIRVDHTHLMDFYIGGDPVRGKELLLFSEHEPAKLKSSKSVDIVFNKRKDGKWVTHFQLLKPEQEDVFIRLCWDLIESSRNVKNTLTGIENVISRFGKWQKLMEQGGGCLPESVIRGLIGELLYLKSYVMRRFDIQTAISVWLGPEGSDRDFVYGNTWTEVKTISPGGESIHITSIEQLDTNVTGKLAVVYIDLTSQVDDNGFSLYNLIDEMKNILLPHPTAAAAFEEKLLSIGYYDRDEYKDKYYCCDRIRFFDVNDNFPRIRREGLNSGITKVKYDILVSSIGKFEVNEGI